MHCLIMSRVVISMALTENTRITAGEQGQKRTLSRRVGIVRSTQTQTYTQPKHSPYVDHKQIVLRLVLVFYAW